MWKHPLRVQVAMCEQLAVYLAKFKTPVVVTAAADSSAAVTAAPPEGYKVHPLHFVLPRWLSLAFSLPRPNASAQARLGVAPGC